MDKINELKQIKKNIYFLLTPCVLTGIFLVIHQSDVPPSIRTKLIVWLLELT